MSEVQIPNIQGLTTTQAKKLQAQFGKNELVPEKNEGFHPQCQLPYRDILSVLLQK